MTTTSGHLRELEPTIALRPEDSARLADWRNPKGLPSDLPRKTVSRWDAKGIIVGVSACMTASREQSNQSFEIDRGATVCLANRRFFFNNLFVRLSKQLRSRR
jgi:hypothetical protein